MFKPNLVLPTTYLLVAGLWGAAVEGAEPPQEDLRNRATPSTVALFNGKNLDGWYTWLADTKYKDTGRVFSVVGGHVRISGDGFGYLATRDVYRNYHLVVEYRWGRRSYRNRQGKARDSGLFLHATGPDGNSADGDGAFMMAIECQIMEAAVGDLMLIRSRDNSRRNSLSLSSTISHPRDADGWPFFSPSGTPWSIEKWGRLNRIGKRRDWHDSIGVEDTSHIEKEWDRWNRLECRCYRDAIQVTLNGHVVNSAHQVRPREGKILLQCEGSEIFFRRLDLRKIEPPVPSGEAIDN